MRLTLVLVYFVMLGVGVGAIVRRRSAATELLTISYHASRSLARNQLLKDEDLREPVGIPGELDWYLPPKSSFTGHYLLKTKKAGDPVSQLDVSAALELVVPPESVIWNQTLEPSQISYVFAGSRVWLLPKGNPIDTKPDKPKEAHGDSDVIVTATVEAVVCQEHNCQALVPVSEGEALLLRSIGSVSLYLVGTDKF